MGLIDDEVAYLLGLSDDEVAQFKEDTRHVVATIKALAPRFQRMAKTFDKVVSATDKE